MNAIVGVWLMHLCKLYQTGAVTNSVDQDETPQKRGVSSGSALFVMLSTFLLMVDNINSYMNLDRFHFDNEC